MLVFLVNLVVLTLIFIAVLEATAITPSQITQALQNYEECQFDQISECCVIATVTWMQCCIVALPWAQNIIDLFKKVHILEKEFNGTIQFVNFFSFCKRGL